MGAAVVILSARPNQMRSCQPRTERFINVGHNGGIDAYPGVQEEVLPTFTRLFGLFVYLFGFSCLSSLPRLLRLFVFLALGLFMAHGMGRDSQVRDLEEAESNFASNAIDKRK